MPPYQGGGEMIGTVTTSASPMPQPPHRFEAGTPPIVQAIGLGAAMTMWRASAATAFATTSRAAAYAKERLSRSTG